MTLDEILRSHSTREVADALGAPLRTVQDWAKGNGPVDWLKPVLAEAVCARLDAEGKTAAQPIDAKSALSCCNGEKPA